MTNQNAFKCSIINTINMTPSDQKWSLDDLFFIHTSFINYYKGRSI